MPTVRVAVPVPGLGALTYLVPDGMPVPCVGARALVPLGKRVMTGIVIREPSTTDHGPRIADVKPLIEVLDADAFLPASVVTLAAWVADYYACGVGEALATAMPPRAWIESERHARITDAGEARMLRERGLRREILERLSGGRIVSVAALTPSAAKGTAGKGRASFGRTEYRSGPK